MHKFFKTGLLILMVGFACATLPNISAVPSAEMRLDTSPPPGPPHILLSAPEVVTHRCVTLDGFAEYAANCRLQTASTFPAHPDTSTAEIPISPYAAGFFTLLPMGKKRMRERGAVLKPFLSQIAASLLALLFLLVVFVGFQRTAIGRDTTLAYIYNSIVLRAGIEAEAGTNGLLRGYFPSGTNYIRLGTNGQFTIYGSTGTWTPFTGQTIISNGNVTATQRWFGGLLIDTNGGVTPAP